MRTTIVVVFILSLTLICKIFALSNQPLEWEEIGDGIVTTCSHGNRIYAKHGNFNMTTISVIRGCD